MKLCRRSTLAPVNLFQAVIIARHCNSLALRRTSAFCGQTEAAMAMKTQKTLVMGNSSSRQVTFWRNGLVVHLQRDALCHWWGYLYQQVPGDFLHTDSTVFNPWSLLAPRMHIFALKNLTFCIFAVKVLRNRLIFSHLFLVLLYHVLYKPRSVSLMFFICTRQSHILLAQNCLQAFKIFCRRCPPDSRSDQFGGTSSSFLALMRGMVKLM